MLLPWQKRHLRDTLKRDTLKFSVGYEQAIHRKSVWLVAGGRGGRDGGSSEVGLPQVWQDGRRGGEQEGILQVGGGSHQFNICGLV